MENLLIITGILALFVAAAVMITIAREMEGKKK